MSSLSLFVIVVALASSIKAELKVPKVTDFKVPRHVKAGSSPTLECDFDIGSLRLYAVKYYFDGEEFYKFVPWEEDSKVYLEGTAVSVDVDQSDQNKVTLVNVTRAYTGSYKCEVNTDRPYLTDEMEANMTVTIIPDEKPTIEGFTGTYAPGHMINLNCTGAPSIPPASLAWRINDEEAPEDFIVHYPVVTTEEGLEEARLGLKFTLHDKHYIKSVLKLKCTASVATFYFESEHSHERLDTDEGTINELPTEQELRNKPSAGSSLLVSVVVASFGLCTLFLL